MDVFTLGETMIRLMPVGYTRLEEVEQLSVKIGGSESNVAVALTRLGLRAGWASRLPRNPLGTLIYRRLSSFGVVLDQVKWVEEARAGLYFIEPGAAPRPSRVLYDRAGSAAAGMTPNDFDWTVLDDARHVHLTGITPALSASAAATVTRALSEARARGRTVSFDVNYRARLWSAEQAREVLTPMVQGVDLLICPTSDARAVFGLAGEPEALCDGLARLTGAARVVLTLSEGGALLWADGRLQASAAPHPVQVVDRVGAGDAFDAGMIYGFLAGDPARGLEIGTAMAALKHSMPGDEFISSLAEVEELIDRGHGDIQR